VSETGQKEGVTPGPDAPLSLYSTELYNGEQDFLLANQQGGTRLHRLSPGSGQETGVRRPNGPPRGRQAGYPLGLEEGQIRRAGQKQGTAAPRAVTIARAGREGFTHSKRSRRGRVDQTPDAPIRSARAETMVLD